MGWDQVEERSGNGGAGYLSIKDGEARVIHIIDDEPHTFKSVYFQSLKKSAVIDPDNNPLDGMKGFDIRTRHAINVFDYSDNKVKILAGSNTLFNQLKAVHKEWQGFDSLDLKISRKGSGFDTEYQVVPTRECKWDIALIEGQELSDLTTVFAPTDPEKVVKLSEGVDPGVDFDAEKLEAQAAAEAEAAGDESAPVDEDPPPPPPKRMPPAKPATKAAPPVAESRSALIVKINALIKTKARYKNPAMMKADVQRIGGKDKQSMSQLGSDALVKLLNFIKTVK